MLQPFYSVHDAARWPDSQHTLQVLFLNELSSFENLLLPLNHLCQNGLLKYSMHQNEEQKGVFIYRSICWSITNILSSPTSPLKYWFILFDCVFHMKACRKKQSKFSQVCSLYPLFVIWKSDGNSNYCCGRVFSQAIENGIGSHKGIVAFFKGISE